MRKLILAKIFPRKKLSKHAVDIETPRLMMQGPGQNSKFKILILKSGLKFIFSKSTVTHTHTQAMRNKHTGGKNHSLEMSGNPYKRSEISYA